MNKALYIDFRKPTRLTEGRRSWRGLLSPTPLPNFGHSYEYLFEQLNESSSSSSSSSSSVFDILMENGGNILTETGGNIVLEDLA